jgi:hypothetical protein
MTPDEIQALEDKLKQRGAALDSREQELTRLFEDKGKDTVAARPSSDTSHPAPSSFVHYIKTYVPITLDLRDSNDAQWRELFLVALGRYGLTAHVQGIDASPANTSPTSEWGRDDFTVLNWIYESISPWSSSG